MIKRILTVFILAVCAVFGQTEATLRIATFNVRTPGDRSPNNWRERIPRIRAVLENYQLDIIGVQELVPSQKDALLENDSPYIAVGVGREPDKKGEHCCIFYRKDRFDCLENGTFWLSETPDVPGSRSWHSACRRICTWAKLQDKMTGKLFYHFNTHLDHISDTARRNGAALILSRIEAMRGELPCILTGDMNGKPSSATVIAILEKMKDAKTLSKTPHEGPEQTFHAYKYNPENSSKPPIDFIFVLGEVQVLRHVTISDHNGKEYPSDHFPVMVEIAF